LLRQEGFDVIRMEIVPDDQPTIESALVRLSDEVPLIVTTGGTGIADRDVTPEATRAVCSKLIEGIPERMRAEGTVNTSYAILSRGVCGVRGRTLILNLPGSPTGASESLLAVIEILPHALDLVAGQTEHDDAHPPGDT
jgi:molybdenum cofactor synthesis domain-containing protein